MLLYKYRSLDTWKYVLDILASRRMYAAPFLELNDPMEGYYRYAADRRLSREYEKRIAKAKAYWRICSLTEQPRSTLMWSYYGKGHTGVAIGIRKPTRRARRRVEQVTYDNFITLDGKGARTPRETAVAILSQKLYSWSHEAEHRVFSPTPFVPVAIEEVLLGCKISREDESLVRRVIEVMTPQVEVRKLRRSELVADYGPKRNS